MGRNRSKMSVMRNAVRRIVLAPEKIDTLLHGCVLRNPPLPKENEMKATLGEQLRAKLDEASKRESLNNTLNEWDQDEQKQIKGEIMDTTQKHLFPIKNNASRETFNFVRDNPNLTISQIKAAMVAKGFKENTVSSLVYQMNTAGMVAKNQIDHTFMAIAKEFIPYNIGRIRREEKLKRQAEAKAMQDNAKKVVMITRRTAKDAEDAHNANVAGIGALTVNADQPVHVDGHKIGTFKQHTPWRPEDTVDTLSLAQAKAVHAYLQKLFGAL